MRHANAAQLAVTTAGKVPVEPLRCSWTSQQRNQDQSFHCSLAGE
jgi:hypothetical protein